MADPDVFAGAADDALLEIQNEIATSTADCACILVDAG